MAKKRSSIRIPISNVLLGNDYTGKLYVGAQRKEVNLLLDTGSSSLAVDHKSYDPRKDPKAKVTDLVQEVAYADGSNWVGSVVQTDMTVSATGKSVDLPGVSVAVAYHESVQMFGKTQGILGLAYRSLNDAINVNKPTVPPKYSPNDLRAGHKVFVEPYFMQLEKAGMVANKFAFYTRRSTVHASRNPATDPLNNGYLIIGGGEEAKDLYKGKFKSAVVLSDDWYSVNLKQVIVGDAAGIAVRSPTHQSHAPTNAIIDSGTNGLDLAPAVFDAILAELSPQQVKLVRATQVSTSNINLAQWPTLTFVLQGDAGDIRLDVKPEHYWQMDAWEAGTAVCSLWRGDDEQSILGLPLMNAYFTIFDCSVNHGLGVVRFAEAR
jgi:Eukaryotic aspartyl protease